MTPTQVWAIALYSVGTVFAVWGPGIAAARILRAYKRTKKTYVGSYGNVQNAVSKDTVHRKAWEDAVWGIAEFAFVGLGVVCASIASIILVVESSTLS